MFAPWATTVRSYMLVRRPWWLLMLALPVCGYAQAQPDVKDLLNRMVLAVQTLNYEGTFVYAHDGRMESMHVVHGVGERGERERLLSLNGVAREVIRDDRSVICILPDNQAVVVDKSLPRRPFLKDLPDDFSALENHYRFALLGEDRVADRPTWIIDIVPRDEYRYGYRFWLDQASHMLLKSDLTDVHGKVLEQMMFTLFREMDGMPMTRLQPALTGNGFQRFEHLEPEPQPLQAPATGPWDIARLPAGFHLARYHRRRLPAGAEPLDHLVYSDGLATVSLYADHGADHDRALRGSSRMGAVSAFGTLKDGYQLTVVGEVPLITVEEIGRSARYRKP